jgi:predicted transcriptional regulator
MSSRLQILVPNALDGEVRKAAERARLPMGAWVRRAIEEKLDREGAGLPRDPLAALGALEAPTGDIEAMLAEIEAGRS